MTHTFTDLINQARARLTLDVCAIRENTDDGYGPSEPVAQRFIDDTVTVLEKILVVAVREDLDLLGGGYYLNDEGREHAFDWETAAPETLRRHAAHCAVSCALLRAEAEQQVVNAAAALNRADRLANLTYLAEKVISLHETPTEEFTCYSCGDRGDGVHVIHRPFVCTCSETTRPTMADPCRESEECFTCHACGDELRRIVDAANQANLPPEERGNA